MLILALYKETSNFHLFIFAVILLKSKLFVCQSRMLKVYVFKSCRVKHRATHLVCIYLRKTVTSKYGSISIF